MAAQRKRAQYTFFFFFPLRYLISREGGGEWAGLGGRQGKGTFLVRLVTLFFCVVQQKLMDDERDACATVTMTIAPGGSQETRAATDFCLAACASLRVCLQRSNRRWLEAARLESTRWRLAKGSVECSAVRLRCGGRGTTSSSVAQRGTTQNKQKRRRRESWGTLCRMWARCLAGGCVQEEGGWFRVVMVVVVVEVEMGEELCN
ncbi:hypothetical protein V8C42DRAFT_81298 [Trichoderma barbatum]